MSKSFILRSKKFKESTLSESGTCLNLYRKDLGLSELKTDIVVIGAGVVCLAADGRFALTGLEVVLVEQEQTFGTGTSS